MSTGGNNVFSSTGRDALDDEAAKEMFSIEDIQAEQAEIQASFQSLRFGEQVRQTTLACYKKCGGQIKYPFRMTPLMLIGRPEVCFGDCVNINFEKGPYLKELGEVPEDSIPKKFVWSHNVTSK